MISAPLLIDSPAGRSWINDYRTSVIAIGSSWTDDVTVTTYKVQRPRDGGGRQLLLFREYKRRAVFFVYDIFVSWSKFKADLQGQCVIHLFIIIIIFFFNIPRVSSLYPPRRSFHLHSSRRRK